MKKAVKEAIKKFDETCEKIAKNEPKVEFSFGEAKRIEGLMNDLIDMYNKEQLKIFSHGFETIYMVKNKVKQAEGGRENS